MPNGVRRPAADCRASDNPNIELVLGNVSSLAAVDALARALLERVGQRLDVLVNNAGYFGNESRTSDEGLEMHFAVNVVAPWRLTYSLLTVLRAASGGGRVINLSAGDNPPQTPVPLNVDNLQAEKGFKGLMTMAHSKSVIEAMSMAMARELEPEGVRVNVVFLACVDRNDSIRGNAGPPWAHEALLSVLETPLHGRCRKGRRQSRPVDDLGGHVR